MNLKINPHTCSKRETQNMIKIILFIINICLVVASNDCFKLDNDHFALNVGNTMEIYGIGKMCNCDNYEMLGYKNAIQVLIFQNTITSIGNKCFMNFVKLNRIDFSSSIQKIGEYAFYNTNLTQILIPQSVKLIESNAFGENKALESINFEEGMNEISVQPLAFENNEKLTKIHIPKRLKQFDSNIFNGCSNIKEITVSKDHEKYQVKENVLFEKEGKKLLFYSPGLENEYYSIPSNVNEIEQKSFIMNNIPSLYFSNQVNTISESLNYGNKNLTTLYIPETMNYIDSYSFSFSESLETVIIASSSITIDSYAFYGCEKLKNVIITSQIIEIGDKVFDNCKELKEIKVSKELKSDIQINGIEIKKVEIGKCGEECFYTIDEENKLLSFYGSGSLTSISETLTEQQIKEITNITISSSITMIGDNLFDSFDNLQRMNYDGINKPICTEKTFGNIPNIKYVIVPIEYNSKQNSKSILTLKGSCGDGCLFILGTKSGRLQINGGEMKDYENINEVPWYSYMENIKSVSFETVKKIGNNCFNGAINLTEIIIPDSVEVIENNAFKDCKSLESITFGKSVSSINGNPFVGCSKLKNVKIESNEYFKFDMGMILTKNDTELVAYLQTNKETHFIFLPDELETIREKAFYGNTYLEMIVIPMNVKTIGDYSFSGCNQLKYVYYLGTQQSPTANDNIFSGLSNVNLKVKNGYSFTIGSLTSTPLNKVDSNQVKYFIDSETGLMVFYGNGESEVWTDSNNKPGDKYSWYSSGSQIKHVIFEKGVTKIAQSSFYNYYSNYPNIKTVRIGSSVTTIEYVAFYQCKSLTTITIPEGLTTIGRSAFSWCSSLTTITIPESVTSIGLDAFFQCTSLTTVIMKSTNQLTFDKTIFWKCDKLTTIHFYSLYEPKYSIESTCHCTDSGQTCAPFYCNTPSITVHVPKEYTGSRDTFCEKDAIIVVGQTIDEGKCGSNCKWIISEINEMIIYGEGLMDNYADGITPWKQYASIITSVRIKSGISIIGTNAFKDFINLESITIGSSITSINGNPFIGCSKLRTVKFESNQYFKYENGMILTKNDKELIFYLATNTETDFIFLPDELQTIHPYAFYGNNYLEMIVIPMNVKTIGNFAFNGCSNLKTIYYLGTTQPSGNDNMFAGLKNVTLKVKNGYSFTIGSLQSTALGKNDSGQVKYFLDDETGLMVFYGNGYYEPYSIFNGYWGASYSWYSSGEKIKHLIFEQGIMSVHQESFYNYFSSYPNLKNVRIGKTVTSIEESAFKQNLLLKTITIPENVTSIGEGAFSLCSSLTTVVIKSTNQLTFDIKVFWDCGNISTIYFYSLIDPIYSTETDCYTCNGKYYQPCAPFSCNTPDNITVYIPKNSNSTATTFAGKEVTIKREL